MLNHEFLQTLTFWLMDNRTCVLAPAAAPLLCEERRAAWRPLQGVPALLHSALRFGPSRAWLPKSCGFTAGQARVGRSGAGQSGTERGRAGLSGVMVRRAGNMSRNDHVGSVPKPRVGQDEVRLATTCCCLQPRGGAKGRRGRQLPAGASGLPYRLTLPGSFSRMR